jgi:RNA polymerase sigma-70 factor (ECF subfamily)
MASVPHHNCDPVSLSQAAGPGYLDSLIVTVARGEQAAFEALARQLAGPIYRMALTVTRDPAQAEEVSQEVLIELWRTAGHFDPGMGSALAWAITIARRRSIDRVRSAAAAARRDLRSAEAAAWPDQVDDTVAQLLEHERLTRLLNRLSEPQRQVILLIFYDGYTHTEVAAILGIALGTVKSRVRAGLTRLREQMLAAG